MYIFLYHPLKKKHFLSSYIAETFDDSSIKSEILKSVACNSRSSTTWEFLTLWNYHQKFQQCMILESFSFLFGDLVKI